MYGDRGDVDFIDGLKGFMVAAEEIWFVRVPGGFLAHVWTAKTGDILQTLARSRHT